MTPPSAEDIEKMAVALWEAQAADYFHDRSCWPDFKELPAFDWDNKDDWRRTYYVEARFVLTVVLPAAQAEAWDEGFYCCADSIRHDAYPVVSSKPNPYRPAALDRGTDSTNKTGGTR